MSGINVEHHMVLVYAIAGLLAAVAAHRALARENLTAQAGMGVMYELDAIAMAVIGGIVALGRARLDRRHRARRADLRRHHLRLHLPEARRLLPGDDQGRDHRRRRRARPVAAAPRRGRAEGDAPWQATSRRTSRARTPASDAELGKIILRTEGLTKHYGGVHALEDANFELREGEHVAIVGDNGAGKSTFVRQITGVEQPTAGKICFDGQQVDFAGPLEAREAGIETVFQNLALADDLDVPVEPLPRPREDPLQPRAVLLPRRQGRCASATIDGAGADRRQDPEHQQHDPQHVGRPAAVRRDRPRRHLRTRSSSSWTSRRRRSACRRPRRSRTSSAA